MGWPGSRWRRCWSRSCGRALRSALQLNAACACCRPHRGRGSCWRTCAGFLWFAGTCYWIFDTMHRYGGMPVPVAVLALILFCHVCRALSRDVRAAAGLGCRTRCRCISGSARAGGAPFLWVAVELARTRITAFPWELLGYAQTGNFALTRIATLTGVYGLSFEIVLVNSVFAAAFLVRRRSRRQRRKWLLAAASAAAVILQAGQWLAPPPPSRGSHRAPGAARIFRFKADWTREYFQNTLRDLTGLSLKSAVDARRTRADLGKPT